MTNVGCVDYRALNKVIVLYKFPIPMIEELFNDLHEVYFFTKLDLKSDYHQVRVKVKMCTRQLSVLTNGIMSSLLCCLG